MISISKKLCTLVICFIIIFSSAYAVVKPTSKFYINDYANILSSETEQYIINVNTSLESQTGAQVVVVTIPNLGGDSLEEYATTLFREFGIGNKMKNNGVLLLLALEERQFRVEVGYGLEGALNDSKTGRIQDQYIIPYLKDNKWDEGIKNGFDAVLEEICKEYNVAVTSDKPVVVGNSNGEGGVNIIASFIIGTIIGAVAKGKKWSQVKGIGATVLVIVVLTIGVSYITLKQWFNIIGMIVNMIVAIVSYVIAFNGNNARYGVYGGGGRSSGGGFSSGGFSGGGGRSGGGGSSRSF